MYQKIMLVNRFHNTRTGAMATNGKIGPYQAKRIRKDLCGHNKCQCGQDELCQYGDKIWIVTDIDDEGSIFVERKGNFFKSQIKEENDEAKNEF